MADAVRSLKVLPERYSFWLPGGRSPAMSSEADYLLREIEPTISVSVEQIPRAEFETAVIQCRELIRAAEGSIGVSLSGDARDVLLPLRVATMAHERAIESTLGYDDIDD